MLIVSRWSEPRPVGHLQNIVTRSGGGAPQRQSAGRSGPHEARADSTSGGICHEVIQRGKHVPMGGVLTSITFLAAVRPAIVNDASRPHCSCGFVGGPTGFHVGFRTRHSFGSDCRRARTCQFLGVRGVRMGDCRHHRHCSWSTAEAAGAAWQEAAAWDTAVLTTTIQRARSDWFQQNMQRAGHQTSRGRGRCNASIRWQFSAALFPI